MDYKFSEYKIQILESKNHQGKFVATIEEFYNVICFIDIRTEASEKLKPLFEKEIVRLKDSGQSMPKPGSGKAKITLAANGKIEKLRPFADEFWEKILGTSYSTSFVSDESCFQNWEHYLQHGKQDLIERVKQTYSVDITTIYNKPVYEILTAIKNKS